MLLIEHSVSPSIAASILHNPIETLGINYRPIKINTSRSGVVKSLDQTRLGELVNRELGGGGNDYEGDFSSTSGLILANRLGDIINAGDELCSIYTSKPLHELFHKSIEACFEIT